MSWKDEPAAKKHTILAKYLNLFPTTQVKHFMITCNFSPNQSLSSNLYRQLYSCTHIHIRTYIHIDN